MAKGGPTAANPITFTSGVQKHTNTQTLAADASAAAAEAIATPGYSDSLESGMVVLGAFLLPNGLATGFPTGALTANQRWSTQIQTGDRSATPALIAPNGIGYFADLSIVSAVTTSGGALLILPLPIIILQTPPVVVMPEFTVCHQGANVTQHNDELVHVAVLYRTALLHASLYTTLLRNQQRTS